jgi:glycosyltransferase involved in cell wall biosynthesis
LSNWLVWFAGAVAGRDDRPPCGHLARDSRECAVAVNLEDRMTSMASTAPITSVVLITATEPEPRSFGKQVVLGGILDHLCARLGADQVHVILIGRPDHHRPTAAYRLHVIAKPSATEQLRAVSQRVVRPPYCSLQEAALWSGRVLMAIAGKLAEIRADLQIWDTMRTGQYARQLGRKPRVLYADDLFSQRYASMLERIERDPSKVENPLGEFGKMLPGVVGRIVGRKFAYRRLLQLEQRLTTRSEDAAPDQFDATFLVNAQECTELAARTGNPTISTLLPMLREPVARQRHWGGDPVFVFLGGLDFPPNRDGLGWFLATFRDEVLAAIPDFRLLVVGRGSAGPLPEAAAWGDHVQTLGWVDDLDEVLNSCAALLSPLRIGSGTKIKVLEALARGLPVVATREGVLGLPVGRQDGCLVASSAADLVPLLATAAAPAVNQGLSVAARGSWRRHFSPEVIGPHYDAAFGLAPHRVLVPER